MSGIKNVQDYHMENHLSISLLDIILSYPIILFHKAWKFSSIHNIWLRKSNNGFVKNFLIVNMTKKWNSFIMTISAERCDGEALNKEFGVRIYGIYSSKSANIVSLLPLCWAHNPLQCCWWPPDSEYWNSIQENFMFPMLLWGHLPHCALQKFKSESSWIGRFVLCKVPSGNHEFSIFDQQWKDTKTWCSGFSSFAIDTCT